MEICRECKNSKYLCGDCAENVELDNVHHDNYAMRMVADEEFKAYEKKFVLDVINYLVNGGRE